MASSLAYGQHVLYMAYKKVVYIFIKGAAHLDASGNMRRLLFACSWMLEKR